MSYTEGDGKTISVSRDELHWEALIIDATSTETSNAVEVAGCRNITVICICSAYTDNSGTFTVDISPDNSNWHTVDWMYVAAGDEAPAANIALTGAGTKLLRVPHAAAYIRVKLTIVATGTYSAILMAN